MCSMSILGWAVCLMCATSSAGAEEGVVLSGHAQLFLDDYLVAKMDNLTRRLARPIKESSNPLIVQDRPWEAKSLQIYGTVLYEPKLQKYRCWYLAAENDGVVVDRPEGPITVEYYQCYAESDDGLRWSKPSVGVGTLGSHARHNAVILGGHGFCVLPEVDESDVQKRYKGVGGGVIGFSPDGIRWQLHPWSAVGKNDTSSCVVKWKGEYLAYVRNQGRWENGVMREVGLCVSTDFVNWTPKKTVFTTDEKDGYPWTQPYGMAVTAYGDQLIGIVWLIRLDRKPDNNKHGIIDRTQLVVSRDGRTWSRVADRACFLAPDRGSWDRGGVWPGTTMWVKDGQIHIYYTGTQNRHGEPFARPAIGLARLPVDRFVGLTPKKAGTEGIVETVPIRVSADDLIVNGDGEIRVEVLSCDGTILSGYDRRRCRRVADGVHCSRIVWGEKADEKTLGDVAPRSPVRLRFVIGKGELFAFQLRNRATP